MVDSLNSTVVVKYKLNNELNWHSLSAAIFNAGTQHNRLNMPMGAVAKRALIRVENNEPDQDFGLLGLIVGHVYQPSRSGR